MTTNTNELVQADATCREHGVPAWRCCDDHPGMTIDAADPADGTISTSLTGIQDLDTAILHAAREHAALVAADTASGLGAESAYASVLTDAGCGGVIAVSFTAAGIDPDAAWEFAGRAWHDAFVAAYDDRPDFSIVSVEPVCDAGSDVPNYYRVVARLFGPIAHLVEVNPIDDSRKTWGGLLTTWLGMYAPNGAGCALTSAGWDTADQWIDPMADREIGTAAAVELGERILAAAVVP
jgi:hypothetical protein